MRYASAAGQEGYERYGRYKGYAGSRACGGFALRGLSSEHPDAGDTRVTGDALVVLVEPNCGLRSVMSGASLSSDPRPRSGRHNVE